MISKSYYQQLRSSERQALVREKFILNNFSIIKLLSTRLHRQRILLVKVSFTYLVYVV